MKNDFGVNVKPNMKGKDGCFQSTFLVKGNDNNI